MSTMELCGRLQGNTKLSTHSELDSDLQLISIDFSLLVGDFEANGQSLMNEDYESFAKLATSSSHQKHISLIVL